MTIDRVRTLARAAGGFATAVIATLAMAACDRDPTGEPNARVQEVVTSSEQPVVELSNGDTLYLSAAVVEFYRDRGYRQAWTDYDEVLAEGLALLETMGHAERDGLDPARYRYDIAALTLHQIEEDSLEESEEPIRMGEVDMILTEVFTRYANHLAGGYIDPAESDLDWRIERDTVSTREILDRLAAGEDPEALVQELRPAAPEYRRLMEALARYQKVRESGGWVAIPEVDEPVEPGDSGAVVAALRQRLIAEGDPTEAALARKGARPDVYDADLEQALKSFQARHGLEDDGRLGGNTLTALNTPLEDRIMALRLNMDRWRWLPRELGERYVLVNVAGFEMEVVENDSTIMTQNVVVGKDAWKTPIFRDTMEHVVLNPYWNVPESIKKDETIPALRRDPGYLTRNNFEAVRGGKVVHNVDHSNLEAYSYRQKPGGNNALGRVKFLFPNDDNIYLHDTPADHLFSRAGRAFSHGCIRVEDPRALAKLVFEKATERSPEDVDRLWGGDQEKWVSLDEPLPVYILYFTAWAKADGSVRFYDDVYGRDETLDDQVEEKMGEPRQVAAKAAVS